MKIIIIIIIIIIKIITMKYSLCMLMRCQRRDDLDTCTSVGLHVFLSHSE